MDEVDCETVFSEPEEGAGGKETFQVGREVDGYEAEVETYSGEETRNVLCVFWEDVG